MKSKRSVTEITLAALVCLLCSCASPKKETDRKPETAAPSTPAPTAVTKTEPPKAPETANAVRCSRDSESRMIVIDKIDPKGCKLQYTKWGKQEEVASSRVGTSHCETVRDRIKKNLTDAKFSCTP